MQQANFNMKIEQYLFVSVKKGHYSLPGYN